MDTIGNYKMLQLTMMIYYFRRGFMNKTIIVSNLVSNNLAVSTESAESLFELLNNSIKNKEKVSVDFSGLKTLTTAFLNASIGDLYSKWDRDTLNDYIYLVPESLTPLQYSKVKLVMDNAKNKLSQNDINEEM